MKIFEFQPRYKQNRVILANRVDLILWKERHEK